MDRLLTATGIIVVVWATTALGCTKTAPDHRAAIQKLTAELALQPTSETTLRDMAEAYEKAGDPCRAMHTWAILSLVSFEHRGRADSAVARISQTPDCKGHLPVEGTTVNHELHENLFVFPTHVGNVETRLGMDTAAFYTYLPLSTFRKIADAKNLGQHLTFHSAFGKLEGDLFHVPGPLKIGQMVVGPLDVVVVPRLEHELAGLMGQDVLARFRATRTEGDTWSFKPLF